MNTVTLSGRLAADAVGRKYDKADGTKGGLISFSIADQYGDDDVQYISCSYNSKSKKLLDSLKKGMKVTVIGKLSLRKKDDKWYTNVMVNQMDICFPPKDKKPVESDQEDEIPFE